ncbi:MAG: DUF4381 family protein [Gammaproteobacteria bacterium]|jgi:hypothetical protein|nr:DUF4381 family protein [Gammaproteobacteria bacterium]
MTRDELLLELKDIRSPGEPEWWLLAPAQLLLIILAVSGCGLLLFWLRRRRRRRLLRLVASELRGISTSFAEHGDTQHLSLQLARWLKQVAILAFPERQPQGLTGFAWLVFLDETLGDDRFSAGHGKIFGNTVYRRQAEFEANRMIELCETWLQAVKPRLLRQEIN